MSSGTFESSGVVASDGDLPRGDLTLPIVSNEIEFVVIVGENEVRNTLIQGHVKDFITQLLTDVEQPDIQSCINIETFNDVQEAIDHISTHQTIAFVIYDSAQGQDVAPFQAIKDRFVEEDRSIYLLGLSEDLDVQNQLTIEGANAVSNLVDLADTFKSQVKPMLKDRIRSPVTMLTAGASETPLWARPASSDPTAELSDASAETAPTVMERGALTTAHLEAAAMQEGAVAYVLSSSSAGSPVVAPPASQSFDTPPADSGSGPDDNIAGTGYPHSAPGGR